MSKKRKPNEKIIYHHLNGKRVNVYDLRKNVEYMDKKFGLKLNSPEIWLEPDNYVDIIESRANTNIIALMCGINGIDIKTFLEIDGISVNDVFGRKSIDNAIADELFTDKSVIDWSTKEVFNTNSLMYRVRYVTLMLSKLVGRVGIIADEILAKEKPKHSYAERKIMIMKDIMKHITRFVYCMLCKKVYRNIIMLMEQYIILSRKKYKNYLCVDVAKAVIALRNNCQWTFLHDGKLFDDDLIIHEVLEHAYIFATGKTNTGEAVPEYKYVEGATLEHDLIKLIEALGISIIRNCKNKKYFPGFTAYLESRPMVYSGYYKEARENLSIATGIFAISHMDFIYNDREMHDIIKKMLTPGI